MAPAKSVVMVALVGALLGGALGAPGASGSTIVFEEDRIEGKIRRPQLVLIKAEQRPTFRAMVMQSIGKDANIAEFVSESVIEESPYSGAFKFSGQRIGNYAP